MRISARRPPFVVSLILGLPLCSWLVFAGGDKLLATVARGTFTPGTSVFQPGQPRTLMLNAASYTTGEGGPAIVVVTRGGSVGAAAISYATANGTATAADYVAAAGTLNFAEGETHKAIAISINNDTLVEPGESFSLALNNPVGATLGAPATATITIVDDDTPAIAGQWSEVMNWPVVPIHMHLLPNGKALFWDRHDHAKVWDGTPRLWDPATNQFATLAAPNYDLFCSGHAFMADGKLLVTGGHISLPPPLDSGVGEDKTALFDPQTNAWTPLPLMNAGRWYPSNVTLANGDVLTLGGTKRDGDKISVNTLPQVWQTARNAWRDLTTAMQMGPPDWADYYPFLYLAPNGRVFNAGPQQMARYLDTNGAGAWTNVASSRVAYRDYGTSVLYDDGKVLIVGGNPRDPNESAPTILPSNSAEVIDLAAAQPAWREVRSPAVGRRHHNATLLPDGKVLVTGGSALPGFNNPAGAVFFAEQWDPSNESWQPMAGYSRYRGYHASALLLPDGRVVMGGGGHPDPEGVPPQTNVQIYSPPYLFKGSRPVIAAAPAQVNYGQSFFVQTPDGASIANVNWLRLGSVTHAFDQSQRINRLRFASTTGGLNVTAPVNPSLCPPGHYLLFILNGNGVPSVARVVQIVQPCTVGLTPASREVGAGGGADTIAVTAPGNCEWNAISNDEWITITSGASGAGNGAVGYAVTPNTGPARTGSLSIAGQPFALRQAAATITFRAVSAGAGNPAGSYAEFLRDGMSFYRRGGGGEGGRGFNVAAIDRCTGQLREPAQNFDTWETRGSGAKHNELRTFLQRQPDGTLLLIAVGDEAGLTEFDNCTPLAAAPVQNLYQALESLGSRQIRNYCYRDSWAMIVVKGLPASAVEQLRRGAPADVQASRAAPLTINPTLPLPNGFAGVTYTQTFTATGAAGAAVFNVSAGALPGGLSLSPGGVLTGVPSAPGTFAFTLRAADAGGCVATRDYTLRINNPMANLSAASYRGEELASESIVAAFGTGMGTATQAATATPLPTELAGTRVQVRDTAGTERFAPLFFVSSTQINYLAPGGTAPGVVTVSVTSNGNIVAMGVVRIARVAPGLFTANATGQGAPAGVALRARADGSQTTEPIVQFNTASTMFEPRPIDLGPANEQVFLILFGTGIRGRGSLAAVTCTVGGLAAPVLYAGAQGDLEGLDQVNIGPLPRALAGRGNVDVVLVVDGRPANVVRVNIK